MSYKKLPRIVRFKENLLFIFLGLIIPGLLQIKIAKTLFTVNPLFKENTAYLITFIFHYSVLVLLYIFAKKYLFNQASKGFAIATFIMSLICPFNLLGYVTMWESNHCIVYIDNGNDTSKTFFFDYIDENKTVRIDTLTVKNDTFATITLPFGTVQMSFDTVTHEYNYKRDKKYLFNPYSQNSNKLYTNVYTAIRYDYTDTTSYDTTHFINQQLFNFDADYILTEAPTYFKSESIHETKTVLERYIP